MSATSQVTETGVPMSSKKTSGSRAQSHEPNRHEHENDHDDGESIHTVHTISTNQPRMFPLEHLATHASHSHDAPIQHQSSFVEVPDEIYDRLPHHRKVVIVTLLSFCSFLAPISSTTILAAVPEVAHTYDTTGTIVNLSNALYMLFMGLSPMFWGPLSQVYGRRIVRPNPRSPCLMSKSAKLLFMGTVELLCGL